MLGSPKVLSDKTSDERGWWNRVHVPAELGGTLVCAWNDEGKAVIALWYMHVPRSVQRYVHVPKFNHSKISLAIIYYRVVVSVNPKPTVVQNTVPYYIRLMDAI